MGQEAQLSETDEAAHQQWRVAVLNAYRSHFRKETPPDPQDRIRVGNSKAESVIVPCIDSWVDEKRSLRLAEGEAFVASTAGNVVSPFESEDRNRQAMVNVIYPLSAPQVSDAKIIGHTDCKANAELHDALVNPSEHNGNMAQWMLPMAGKELQKALIDADKRGVDRDRVLRQVERGTVLQSAQNLYEYPTSPTQKVKDRVMQGTLQVIGAMRDLLNRDETGRHPLLVFDPHTKEFCKIEDIYRQEFGNDDYSIAAIEARAAAIKPDPRLATSAEPRIVVPRSETVAEFELKALKAGIHNVAENIGHMAPAR